MKYQYFRAFLHGYHFSSGLVNHCMREVESRISPELCEVDPILYPNIVRRDLLSYDKTRLLFAKKSFAWPTLDPVTTKFWDNKRVETQFLVAVILKVLKDFPNDSNIQFAINHSWQVLLSSLWLILMLSNSLFLLTSFWLASLFTTFVTFPLYWSTQIIRKWAVSWGGKVDKKKSNSYWDLRTPPF